MKLTVEQGTKLHALRFIAWFTVATYLAAVVPLIVLGWFLYQNSARLYQGAKWHAGTALSVEQGLKPNSLRLIAWFALATYLAAAVPLIVLGWFLYQNSARTYQGVKRLASMARWLL
jgi:hypothetical protein